MAARPIDREGTLGLRSTRITTALRRRGIGVAIGAAIGAALGAADVVRCAVADRVAVPPLAAALVVALWTATGAVAGGVGALTPVRRRHGTRMAIALVAIVAVAIAIGRLRARTPRATVVEAGDRPNLLLIVVDTLRADALSAYGYARPTTPRLDALAASGVLFERAVSQAPYTLPSVASILTSRLPSQHGVGGKFAVPLAATFETLPTLLRRAGYATAGFSANPWVAPAFGFAQGFDQFEVVDDVGVYRSSLVLAAWKDADRALSAVDGRDGLLRYAAVRRRAQGVVGNSAKDRLLVGRVGAWLAGAESRRPFFAYVHLMSAHVPYDPPARARQRVGAPARIVVDQAPPQAACYARASALMPRALAMRRALYDAGVAAADDAVGRVLDLLDAAGFAHDTLVIVTADHGEEFYEHANWGHGQSLFQELVHVPLILRWPGVATAGQRIARPVMSVDVVPTMLAAARVAPPPGIVGSNLLDATSAPARPVYAELLGEECRSRIAIDGMRKVLEWERPAPEGSGRLAFDLGADPDERRPLPIDSADFAGPRAALAALDSGSSGPRVSAEPVAIDADQREKLRALGYVE